MIADFPSLPTSPAAKKLADLRSGITVAFTALPSELVYGLFAVAPLGAAYAEAGLRAALTACVMVTLIGMLWGGNRLMVCGSRPATGLILGSLAAFALQQPSLLGHPQPGTVVMALILLCTMLAGIFQWLFGVLRLGRVLKYIPYPVTAGLMLGVGILMILSSIRPALGVERSLPWSDVLANIHPASLFITLVSLGICIMLPRLRSPIPGSILALFFGTALHHLLLHEIGSQYLGGTAGGLTDILPVFSLWQADLSALKLLSWLPTVAFYALTIAALGSIETLLCLSRITAKTAQRTDADNELRSQGIANATAGLCGGTICFGNLTRVTVSLRNGGNSAGASIVYALTLLGIAGFAGQWLSLVPDAVTAGIIIYFAAGMVDDGTRQVVKQLVVLRGERRDEHYRQLLANVTVIGLVALVAVLGDLMKAVGVGVGAAMFLFVTTSMKPVVRRISHADRLRSMKIRAAGEEVLLASYGREIVVLEIDGPLFFGTADKVAEEIDRHGATAITVILDLTAVPELDVTGAHTLVASAAHLAARGKQCVLVGTESSLEKFLDAMGLGRHVPPRNRHHDLDHALQAAEDALLTRHGGHLTHSVVTLINTELAAGLDADQIALLATALVTHEFDDQGWLFNIGDPGDSLFVAASASVDILLPLPDGKYKRLICLAPGVCFGEMALLEQHPRSTSARLLGPSRVWELSRHRLDELLTKHPRVAGRILTNIGIHLARRLRVVTANQSIHN